MNRLEWFFAITLFGLYVTCFFTACGLPFQKGHTVLRIVGIYFPFLWLIGAILPPKEGSRSDCTALERYRVQMEQMTR